MHIWAWSRKAALAMLSVICYSCGKTKRRAMPAGYDGLDLHNEVSSKEEIVESPYLIKKVQVWQNELLEEAHLCRENFNPDYSCHSSRCSLSGMSVCTKWATWEFRLKEFFAVMNDAICCRWARGYHIFTRIECIRSLGRLLASGVHSRSIGQWETTSYSAAHSNYSDN